MAIKALSLIQKPDDSPSGFRLPKVWFQANCLFPPQLILTRWAVCAVQGQRRQDSFPSSTTHQSYQGAFIMLTMQLCLS